ncbi:zinc finger protein 318 [Seriola lalandi dorsalis]|uniref:zinc finger protein 318 n=1 Tax=Seriola lalandi dorsalis TaxID=1841481 RepID=UPI000C6F8D99|nr:zinc finger protein 318 [Seriola lalandi dorsalis]
MYRGRPPPRGGYPPPFEGRGPRPPRPYPAPDYRDDRSRPRPPYHHGYHDHAPPDSYRRSPPRRRYPSPGSGNHRGGEYWAGGPPRERSPSPRGAIPLDHNLVITVGNDMTGTSGPAPSRHHDREYPARPEYERSRSRGRSRDRSLDRSRAKSRGRSKSRPRSQSRSPDRSRAKSRGRSKSRSLDRSRAKSRGRSKSRSPDRSRAKSRGRSKSRSPDRSRAKSRGRSKSRARSKSRPRSRSRSKSRSRSRSRSRGRSRGRSFSKVASHARSKSRQRSRSASSSSSSSSGNDSDEKSRKEFKELKMARRRKELEEMLSLPTKSILKKRNDSEDSPSLRSIDSPRALEGSNFSHVADQLLLAVKGMEPHAVASMLSELRSDPQMANRAGLDAEIKEILNLLGEAGSGHKAQTTKAMDDIDDEEKFLYGDSEEPKPPPASEPVRHHGLDLYGDVTEEVLYGDYPPPKAVIGQTYGLPPGASPHLPASSSMGEVDTRYVSRPTISPDQKITVQVPNPAFPPGTEPLEESERQALEEYEKIQDLLKTIGLDLGVAEITKMAARTKERLHGNKPPPKTPTRCRRYSSGSSDGSRGRRRRSHSGSSSSSSSRSRSRGGTRRSSWSSDDSCNKSAPPKSHKDRDVKETKVERSDATPPLHKEPPPHLPPQTPNPNNLPPHPGVPIPTYPPAQVHGMMAPNYPPPGYGQFGNYLPYMPQQWPPMYPPPRMTLPPQTDEFPPTLPYKQPYNKPPPELGVKALGKSCVQDGEKGISKISIHDRKVSEEQNNESQKQKVLEEREKLKQEREIRMKKKEYLMKELERLRKQQGELLRKKRREKGGHKDPLLQEISHLQEEVMTQISNLRKEHEAAEKKRNEIDKVALILGLSPSDRPRRASKPAEDQESETPSTVAPSEKKKQEAERSPEEQQASSSSTSKQTSAAAPSSSRASPVKPPVSAPPPTPPPEPFEYYDAGNHWCKNCNVTSGSMFDFFTHLHSKTHRKTLDPYDRPWASTPTKIIKNMLPEEKLTKPAKGSEFLLPVRGFFCLLCKEFYGDAICAEEHVTTHAHNEKYKKQMYENPLYEQRRNLDRQAGLSSETSGKKRKHEDDEKGSKDKDEKSKHKKEKKDKEKKKEDDDASQKEEKSKVKKEDGEERLKHSKMGEDSKSVKSMEEERPSYSKKDEDENCKYSKKDDKYRYSKEEEERGDRYKYNRDEEYRYRYRRDDDDRYDDRPKYGPRNDEDKYKYGKHSEFRSKYDRERDEGKPKAEREGFKKPDPGKPTGKPEVIKPEPPPKPYDPPKVLCGPSPAMRAKLRKQSLEAGKPVPALPTTSFGKFTWKKKENMLAKVAEKVAAEFIKEDEAAASQQQPVSVEDSFAKSMAVAKEIAHKLGGQHNMPPSPWVSNGANRGRIRPNLPAPAAVLRKTTMMGKPAPLNTFLSIRPQNTSLISPTLSDGLTKALNAQNALLETKPVPPVGGPEPCEAMPTPAVSRPGPSEAKPPPLASIPAPFEVKPSPPMSRPEPFEAKPPPPVSRLAPFEVKPAPPVSRPEPFQAKPPPPVSRLAPIDVKPAPPVSKPASDEVKPIPSEAKPAASEGKPPPSVAKPTQPAMIKIVSDVAAPGVPESEQTRTVFVKPPPFMNMSEGAQKSEKLKSNLAAAKAQELFGIFYSSTSQSGSSSITKPATDSSSSSNKSTPPAPQAPKPQLHPPVQTQSQSQPPTQVHTAPQPQPQPQPDSKSPPSTPQSHSEIQIASVWSMQSTPAPTPETTSQTVQPKLTPQAQSAVQSETQNQSSTSKSESHITPQTEPEPTPETQCQPKLPLQIQTEPQSKPQPDQGTQSHLDPAPEPEPKPGPKTRGKTTPTKKASPAARPVRQTRSQTRYQTRRQQQQQQNQSEPESDMTSGDSESAASDPKGLDTSDPGSGSLQEEGGSQEMEITPETLGLPPDMTSLDFEYDFNFE